MKAKRLDETVEISFKQRSRWRNKEAVEYVYPKVSGLAAWSENSKWYSSLPLGAVISLFYESF